jgi:hypothetical protein
MMQIVEEKESIKVLRECTEIQQRKSNDYQNPNSNVRQAMHYRRGIDSIHDLIQGKLYRAQSLLEAAAAGNLPNYESIEDTYADAINYCSFAIEYLRGKMDGQDPSRDMFNKRTQGMPASDMSKNISLRATPSSYHVEKYEAIPNGDNYS